MPLLELTTNVQLPDAKAFSLELSKVGAEALGKPEAYISVIIKYNETLTFGGTHDPAFQMMVISLGNINPAATEKYSKALSEFLNQKLGLSNDRGYITFIDPGNANIAFKGTTFAAILGS